MVIEGDFGSQGFVGDSHHRPEQKQMKNANHTVSTAVEAAGGLNKKYMDAATNKDPKAMYGRLRP